MSTIRDLRAAADNHLFAGDHAGALHLYCALVVAQPSNLDVRLRTADALLALGEVQRAAVVYSALARHCALGGYPLHALVVIKILTLLEPQLGSLLKSVADLYGKESPRLGRSSRLAFGNPDQPVSPSTAEPLPLAELCAKAESLASDLSSLSSAYSEKLPPIPLFSDLPAEAFFAAMDAVELRRTRPGEVVFEQGAKGDAFFVIARGTVEVFRSSDDGSTQHLTTLHEGSIFGEMALVAGAPRTATVKAQTDCDLLVFGRDALQAASRQMGVIGRALDQFTQERLLSNLMASAPLFSPLSAKQRFDLMRRFTALEFAAGATIIREGTAGQGLFVVLQGELDVSKVDGSDKVLLATLAPGDVFGEISLLEESVTTATVTAASATTVLFLARDYFQRLLDAVPAVRSYVESLSDERLMDTRIVLDSGSRGVMLPDGVEIEEITGS